MKRTLLLLTLCLSNSAQAQNDAWNTGTMYNLRGISLFFSPSRMNDLEEKLSKDIVFAFKKANIPLFVIEESGGGGLMNLVKSYRGAKPLAMLRIDVESSLDGDVKYGFYRVKISVSQASKEFPSIVTVYSSDISDVALYRDLDGVIISEGKDLIERFIKSYSEVN